MPTWRRTSAVGAKRGARDPTVLCPSVTWGASVAARVRRLWIDEAPAGYALPVDYQTGIRLTRALATDVPALLAAIEASPDFEPDAFRAFAKQGNVREWFSPVAKDPQGRALVGESVAREFAEVAEAQPAKKQALIELGRGVQDAFRGADIPVLFLKGLFVADRFYGDLHRRHQYDLDVLVSLDDLARATQALTALGFVIDERAARRLGRARGEAAAPAPQTITVKRPDGLEVDVHGRTKSRWFRGLEEEVFWRDRQRVSVRDFTFETLSDEHTLLLQSISLALDLRRGAGRVKHFLDLYLMLQALDGRVDWPTWLEARAQDGMLPAIATVWTALLTLWDCAEEFPTLARALGRHRDAVKLRDPGEALRVVQRPRRSRGNLAWFARVCPPQAASERFQDLVVHRPVRLWQTLWPIERLGPWPWDQVGESPRKPSDAVPHER